jgi:hypothetical protein
MAAARKRQTEPRKKTRPTATKQRPPAPSPRATTRERSSASPVRAVEAGLLGLAGDVAKVIEPLDGRSPVAIALDVVASAHASGGAIARALAVPPGSGSAEASALALAWAREQLRVAFRELLDREIAAGRASPWGSTETLAWMLLAACESMAREPPGAIAERVEAMAALVEGVDRRA